jgi:hypothetical protein
MNTNYNDNDNDNYIYNEYEKFVLSRHRNEIEKYKYQIESNINTSAYLLVELSKKYNIQTVNYQFHTYSDYIKYNKIIKTYNQCPYNPFNITIDDIIKYNITVDMYIIKSIYITYEHYLKYKETHFKYIKNNTFVFNNPNCKLSQLDNSDKCKDGIYTFTGDDCEFETYVLYNNIRNISILSNKNISYDFYLKYYPLFNMPINILYNKTLTIDNILHFIKNYKTFFIKALKSSDDVYLKIFEHSNITLDDILKNNLSDNKCIKNFMKNKNCTINDILSHPEIFGTDLLDIYSIKYNYNL